MASGKLHHLIEIERLQETVQPSGAVTQEWTPVAALRAEPVTITASEFLSGFGEGESRQAVWRIRYFPGLTPADRIRHNGQTFDLKEIVEIGRRKGLELRTKRVAT